MKEKSKIFGINFYDISKGAVVAVIGGMVTALQQALTTEPVVLNWKRIVLVGTTAFISYIIKNFFSNSEGSFAKAEANSNILENGPGGTSNPPQGPTGLPTK